METLAALEERVDAEPWSKLLEEIDTYGCVQTGPLPSHRRRLPALRCLPLHRIRGLESELRLVIS